MKAFQPSGVIVSILCSSRRKLLQAGLSGNGISTLRIQPDFGSCQIEPVFPPMPAPEMR
jgi:hypothetical protein